MHIEELFKFVEDDDALDYILEKILIIKFINEKFGVEPKVIVEKIDNIDLSEDIDVDEPLIHLLLDNLNCIYSEIWCDEKYFEDMNYGYLHSFDECEYIDVLDCIIENLYVDTYFTYLLKNNIDPNNIPEMLNVMETIPGCENYYVYDFFFRKEDVSLHLLYSYSSKFFKHQFVEEFYNLIEFCKRKCGELELC